MLRFSRMTFSATSMLPLNISPTPAKTERVFVARIEMVSPDRERSMLSLLNSATRPDEAVLAELEKLDFGRFENGAMEIAIDLQGSEMRGKFFALRQFAASRETSERR